MCSCDLRLTNKMGQTFGARKRPGQSAVPTHWCRQATIVMTQTMTTAADNAHGAAWAGGSNIEVRTDNRCTKMHCVVDNRILRNPFVSSSPLRKFCPILAFGGEGCENSQCIICVDGVAMERHTHGGWAESIIWPRSRYPNPRILVESIMWSRSRYRGVDFYTSQTSGVDFMGLNEFKILKGKSQKNRLRV